MVPWRVPWRILWRVPWALSPGVGGQTVGTGSEVSFLAGLFNLRGNDIPYNPVFYSYTLLTNTSIRWAASPCGHGAWTVLSNPPSLPGPAPNGPYPGPAAPLP